MGGTLSRPMLDHKLFLHVYTIHNTIYTTYIHDVMESVKVHDDRFFLLSQFTMESNSLQN